jgi:hypothetical protein
MASVRKIAATGIVTALAALALAPAASAAPPPEYEQFANCPWENPETDHCVYWVFEGGSYTLGAKTITLQNPVTFEGGYTGESSEIEFHGAETGQTLSKTPQPLPGGLSGVTAPTSWPKVLQEAWNTAIEEGFTGVNTTLELAAPATEIGLNLENLLEESGSTLSLPVKVKLDSVLLGENCYIGSDKKPIQLELTTGTSGALKGTPGELSFNGSFTITTFTGIEIVDGTYAVPTAKGCGGAFSAFVDPLVDSIFGLPSASGKNAATFEGVFQDADATAMRD